MIATILSLNGGLLTTILCIDNQYLVTINSQIKLSVCLSVCLSVRRGGYLPGNQGIEGKIKEKSSDEKVREIHEKPSQSGKQFRPPIATPGGRKCQGKDREKSKKIKLFCK